MVDTQQDHQTNQSFYDRISHAYDAIANANEHAAREVGERLLDAKPGQKILELGFGTGNSLIELAQKVGPSGRVVGLDVSSGMREVTEKKVRQANLEDRVELLLGDAVKLDLPDNSFDAAFMSFTLELFSEEDIQQVLKELARVLSPGASFANVSMATVQPGERESMLEKTYQWMHRHFPHIVDCRPIDVRPLLESNGFRIAEETRLEIWSMPVSAILATVAD